MNRVKLLKAIADETRLKILDLLIGGERCACSLPPVVGKAQSTVSGHLKVLEEAEILKSRHLGTNIWYSIKSDEVLAILKMMSTENSEI